MDESGADEVGLVVDTVDDDEVVGRRADSAVQDDGVEVGAGEELFGLGEGDGGPSVIGAGVAGDVDGGGREQSGNRASEGTQGAGGEGGLMSDGRGPSGSSGPQRSRCR